MLLIFALSCNIQLALERILSYLEDGSRTVNVIKKKIIYFLLSQLLIFQSCAVYQKTPVPLSEACNKGKVLIVDNRNKKIKSRKIERIRGEYYATYKVKKKGIDGEYQWSEHTIQVEDDKVQVFLSKEESTTSRIWVELTNKTKVTGILYNVTDSSIWIINNLQGKYLVNKRDYLNQNYNMEECMAKDIVKIKLRKVNRIGRVAWKASLVGAGSGFAFGLIAGASSGFGSPLVFGAGYGSLGLAAGGLTGAIIGSKKEVYFINKNIFAFKKYQMEFQNKAVLSY